MSRIALFGGSFNPIHNGHLHLAQTVHQQCGLDRMLLMPSGTAPHKSSDAYAPAADRLAMCRLATESNPAFDVTDHTLLTGIVTEKGVIHPPFDERLAALFG